MLSIYREAFSEPRVNETLLEVLEVFVLFDEVLKVGVELHTTQGKTTKHTGACTESAEKLLHN